MEFLPSPFPIIFQLHIYTPLGVWFYTGLTVYSSLRTNTCFIPSLEISSSPFFSSYKHTLSLSSIILFFLARRLFQGIGRDDIPHLFDTRKMQLHTHKPDMINDTKKEEKKLQMDLWGGARKRDS
jgi:hypothetical protein